MKIAYFHFRFAGTDGVTLEAERWKEILESMGHEVTFIAGELDREGILIPTLHFTHPRAYEIHEKVITNNIDYKIVEKEVFAMAGEIEGELRELFQKLNVDLCIVSNVFSLPIHFSFAVALERVLLDLKIPTISRNHDFWWERQRYLKSHCFTFFEKYFPPKENSLIKHVTINTIAQAAFKEKTGLDSVVIHDCFNFNAVSQEADSYLKDFRADFNIKEHETIFLQPTRIIPRKRIELAMQLVSKLNDKNIVFVLSGYHGDETGDYMNKLIETARELNIRAEFIGSRVNGVRKIKDGFKYYTLWDCFRMSDFVTYTPDLEGFGNQFIEAVAFKKPIYVNRYSVYKTDIEPLGFDVVAIDGEVTDASVIEVKKLLDDKKRVHEMVEHNFELGKKYFSYEVVKKQLRSLGL